MTVFHSNHVWTAAAIVLLAVLAGCEQPPTGSTTLQATASGDSAATTETLSDQQKLTLPSGATLNAANDWSVTEAKDGLTLEDPEKRMQLEVVEVNASKSPSAAIAAAWSSRRSGFDREELAAAESPGREGWDLSYRIDYKTSPEESRLVRAFAKIKGELAVMLLVDGPRADVQRRLSQLLLVRDSLRPAGYVRETYVGRTPRPLTGERVAYLKQFIDEMRQAADVPGVSVVLFDKNQPLIEAGFGVRERGRPEPVSADSLYMIASNTKALTTLLLAKLVDEVKFSWDTPVKKVFPAFKLADPEVTERVLIKHLVCACTGLPRQDFEWAITFDRSSPQGQLDVLATMVPTTEFGELYQYNNPLASAAGYIGAQTIRPGEELGKAYDEVMREKVFEPLGMTRTTFSFEEALVTDHAFPHSQDMSLVNVPIDMGLNHSVIHVRPAGGAWSSAKDYARYVRLELAKGRLADGSTFVSEKNLLARRAPQVRMREEGWYGMGLRLKDVKGVRVISHGGSMFGYKSNFFFVPDLGLGGVILTNADSGRHLTKAIMRRTLELVYDGKPEAEEDLVAAVREERAYLTGEQKGWVVPPNPAEVKRLAKKYRNDTLGEIVVQPGKDEVVFQVGGLKSEMATEVKPDGTTSFVTIAPGIRAFEFNAPAANGTYNKLVLRDRQHSYEYEAVK